MQNTTNDNEMTVKQLKDLQITSLSEVEKLKLKNSRPTPDVSITQECNSRGLKFIIFKYVLMF